MSHFSTIKTELRDRQSLLEALEDQAGASVAQHKAVPVAVERAARRGRIVVAE